MMSGRGRAPTMVRVNGPGPTATVPGMPPGVGSGPSPRFSGGGGVGGVMPNMTFDHRNTTGDDDGQTVMHQIISVTPPTEVDFGGIPLGAQQPLFVNPKTLRNKDWLPVNVHVGLSIAGVNKYLRSEAGGAKFRDIKNAFHEDGPGNYFKFMGIQQSQIDAGSRPLASVFHTNVNWGGVAMCVNLWSHRPSRTSRETDVPQNGQQHIMEGRRLYLLWVRVKKSRGFQEMKEFLQSSTSTSQVGVSYKLEDDHTADPNDSFWCLVPYSSDNAMPPPEPLYSTTEYTGGFIYVGHVTARYFNHQTRDILHYNNTQAALSGLLTVREANGRLDRLNQVEICISDCVHESALHEISLIV